MLLIGIGYGGRRCILRHRPSSEGALIPPDQSAWYMKDAKESEPKDRGSGAETFPCDHRVTVWTDDCVACCAAGRQRFITRRAVLQPTQRGICMEVMLLWLTPMAFATQSSR